MINKFIDKNTITLINYHIVNKKNPKWFTLILLNPKLRKLTKYILENVKPFILKGTIILFDELYNIPGWDVGEYKALTEVFNENEYKFIAFSKYGRQVAIKLL